MEHSTEKAGGRRAVLKRMAVAGGAATAAVAGGAAIAKVSEETPQGTSEAPGEKGYRETPHIKQYYRLARF